MNRSVGVEAEQQLILMSAGTEARRQEGHEDARRLIRDVNWPRLADTLDRRRLLPILGPRIVEFAQESPNAAFEEAVNGAIRAGRRRGASLQLVSIRIAAML